MRTVLMILFGNAALTKIFIYVLVGGVLFGSYKWKDVRLWWVQRQAQSCEQQLLGKTKDLGSCRAQLSDLTAPDDKAVGDLQDSLEAATKAKAATSAAELNQWLESRFLY